MRPQATSELSFARPCCAVIRHAERADASWELEVQELARKWPCDPPLSPAGLEDALVAARELLASVESDVHFHVVVSSPYMRCIQTAIKVCTAIGPSAELMIDEQFGEIYGPDIMGDEEPQDVLRPREEVWQYCIENRVKVRSKVMGKFPVWPEDTNRARLRFVQRFLRYLHRAALTRRNFIIVTHADCVAAALGMMPSTEGRILKSVEYGGFFVAQAGQGVALKKIKPAPQTETNRAELTTLGNVDASCDSDSSGHTDSSILAANFAWQISYGRIRLGHRASEDLSKRICRWARDSDFSEEKISSLLRFLPEEQLTDTPGLDVSYGSETMTFSGIRTIQGTERSHSSGSCRSTLSAKERRFLKGDPSTRIRNSSCAVSVLRRLSPCFNILRSCCPYLRGRID